MFEIMLMLAGLIYGSLFNEKLFLLMPLSIGVAFLRDYLNYRYKMRHTYKRF